MKKKYGIISASFILVGILTMLIAFKETMAFSSLSLGIGGWYLGLYLIN